MSIEEIMAMPDEELARQVAEKVMGWTRAPSPDPYWWKDGERVMVAGGMTEESPGFDYQVLCHVREKWADRIFEQFEYALESMFERNRDNARRGVIGGDDASMYHPGDYARAALAAMETP